MPILLHHLIYSVSDLPLLSDQQAYLIKAMCGAVALEHHMVILVDEAAEAHCAHPIFTQPKLAHIANLHDCSVAVATHGYLIKLRNCTPNALGEPGATKYKIPCSNAPINELLAVNANSTLFIQVLSLN